MYTWDMFAMYNSHDSTYLVINYQMSSVQLLVSVSAGWIYVTKTIYTKSNWHSTKIYISITY